MSYGSLRKRLCESIAQALYDEEYRKLLPYQQKDVDRFVGVHIMQYVEPFIERNYERITNEGEA